MTEAHRFRPASAFFLALSAFLAISLAGASSASAQGKKGGEWQEPDAGSVPNSFGALIQVAGKAGEYSMMFRNEEGELRIVELTGGKVPQLSLLIRREEPESKPKAEPGQKWRDAEAGVVPASYGEVVSFTGTKGSYGLVFRSEAGVLRLIDFQGTQVKKLAKRIDRKEPVSTKSTDGPDGWKEEVIGLIPSEFGPLVSVMGASPQLSFIFQDEAGQIRIIDLAGTRIPQKATKISREY